MLCHCLRVDGDRLLHPLKWQRMRVDEICSRGADGNKEVLCSAWYGYGSGSSGCGKQACASCDSTTDSSGAYHVKSMESPSLAHWLMA